MSIEPMESQVYQLNPPRPDDPRDAALVDLSRELNTERKAAKAVLAAFKQLDARVSHQDRAIAGLEADKAELTKIVDTLRQSSGIQEEELTRQREINRRLYADMRNIGNELALERNKPLWRRVLNR